MKDKWVVMGNDFPSGVFSTEEKAKAFVDRKIEENRLERERGDTKTRIYWRYYKFEEDAKC